ncbi:hypothetical protein AM593_08335, partial [Mytilus galloprovincialis]
MLECPTFIKKNSEKQSETEGEEQQEITIAIDEESQQNETPIENDKIEKTDEQSNLTKGDGEDILAHTMSLNKETTPGNNKKERKKARKAANKSAKKEDSKFKREIQPVKSSSKVTEEGIEINLIKAKKEQWEILERAASPIISERSELAQKDSTSVGNTTQSSQPCQSPKPSTSYGSCVTVGSKKRPSMDGNDCPSNTNSERKKRKSLQNSDEQVEDLLKEMVDKKEIEHFITTKILMAYPEFDVANNTPLIKETLQK